MLLFDPANTNMGEEVEQVKYEEARVDSQSSTKGNTPWQNQGA